MTHRRWSLNSNAFGNCCITWNYKGLDIWAKYKSLKPARRIQQTGGKSDFSGRRCASHSRDQYAVQTCGQSSAIPSLSGPGRKGNHMLEIVPTWNPLRVRKYGSRKIMAREVNWAVLSQPSLQWTNTGVLRFSTYKHYQSILIIAWQSTT